MSDNIAIDPDIVESVAAKIGDLARNAEGHTMTLIKDESFNVSKGAFCDRVVEANNKLDVLQLSLRKLFSTTESFLKQANEAYKQVDAQNTRQLQQQ